MNVGLGFVAGVDELEAFLFRLCLPGSRSARHFAGAFGCRAGRSSSLLKEICPRGNNKVVIIYIFMFMINVYISC